MAETAQYLTLGIEREHFGIDIASVREILDMRPISRLPHAPDFLLGMIDVRGTSYPVVDLRLKLGLPRIEPTDTTRIIILELPRGGRMAGVGIVADRVVEVTALDRGPLEDAPEVGGRWTSRCIAGIGRKGPDFVVIFDLSALLDGDALAPGTMADELDRAA